jgi:hypothetical protein
MNKIFTDSSADGMDEKAGDNAGATARRSGPREAFRVSAVLAQAGIPIAFASIRVHSRLNHDELPQKNAKNAKAPSNLQPAE